MYTLLCGDEDRDSEKRADIGPFEQFQGADDGLLTEFATGYLAPQVIVADNHLVNTRPKQILRCGCALQCQPLACELTRGLLRAFIYGVHQHRSYARRQCDASVNQIPKKFETDTWVPGASFELPVIAVNAAPDRDDANR
jgi:hypothetical protein